jgi:hypothetical protein
VDLEVSMDPEALRKHSLQVVVRLGYSTNNALPLLNDAPHLRRAKQVVDRLLCLNAVAASAYGFDRREAKEWLAHEAVFQFLTDAERLFVESGVGDSEKFKLQIEGMWALAWSLGMVAELDFARSCDKNFVRMLPNLKNHQSADAFRSEVRLRAAIDVLAAADLAYCLHWAVRDSQVHGHMLPGKVPAYVIEERRRALDWLLGTEAWDQISLDT